MRFYFMQKHQDDGSIDRYIDW